MVGANSSMTRGDPGCAGVAVALGKRVDDSSVAFGVGDDD